MKRFLSVTKEYFISIIYFFRQICQYLSKTPSATLGGNLDPFYIFAPLEIFDKIKQRKIPKEYFIVFVPILSFTILQMIFIKDIIIYKLIIKVTKICICVLVMFYVKEHILKLDLYKTAKIVSAFMSFFMLVSLIFNNSGVLWRFNDIINKYTATRLQFFYLEPSELGFHAAILIIILVSCFVELDNKKEKAINLMCIFVNLIVIYFARPLGAIVILVGTLVIMLLWNLIKKFNKKKLYICIVIAIIAIIVFSGMYIAETPTMKRIVDTINGNDSSNRYRIGVSVKILTNSLSDNFFLGCGLGNLNSTQFRVKYASSGIVEVLANSFIYFIIETGLFGIIGIIGLIYYLSKYAFKGYSLIKVGLLVFLIAYQIFGGHFTSGLTWALYGIMISQLNEKDIVKKR